MSCMHCFTDVFFGTTFIDFDKNCENFKDKPNFLFTLFFLKSVERSATSSSHKKNRRYQFLILGILNY